MSLLDRSDSKERLAEIIWGADVGTWEWGAQTGATRLNDRWADIVGYTLEELSPISIDTWRKLAHPDDLKKSDELLEKLFSRELEHYEIEIRMRHKNGDWVWVLDRGKVAEWTEDGKPLRVCGAHLDITKRKNAEEALRKSEKQLHLANIEKDKRADQLTIAKIEKTKATLNEEKEKEKRLVYKATVHSAQHILNNLLQSMLLFKMKAEKSDIFDDKTKSQFAHAMSEGTELVKKLGAVEVLTESNIKASVAPKSDV